MLISIRIIKYTTTFVFSDVQDPTRQPSTGRSDSQRSLIRKFSEGKEEMIKRFASKK